MTKKAKETLRNLKIEMQNLSMLEMVQSLANQPEANETLSNLKNVNALIKIEFRRLDKDYLLGIMTEEKFNSKLQVLVAIKNYITRRIQSYK